LEKLLRKVDAPSGVGGNKKACLISQTGLHILSESNQTCTLTYLFPHVRDGVGTFLQSSGRARVAKASSGQFPLPFLISILKNWAQR